MKLITAWFNRNFSDPQVIILGLALVILLAVVLLFGRMLAPVVAAIVIAYLLDGLIAPLQYSRNPENYCCINHLSCIFVFCNLNFVWPVTVDI